MGCRTRLAVLACAVPSLAAAELPREPMLQRGGTFHEPPARVDPVFTPQAPNRPAGWQDPGEPAAPLSLRLTLDAPVRGGGAGAGQGQQGSPARSATIRLAARARLPTHPHWFAQVTLVRHLQSGRQRPWDPDFTYTFGYERFEPGTFSWTYANHTGTRFSPDTARGERRWNFLEGQWTLAWRFEPPAVLQDALLLGDGDSALCSAEGHLTPRYNRATGGPPASNKWALSLGCRYAHPSRVFAHLRVFGYPQGGQQQPWDPDFVYGIGWGDSGPGGFVVEYNNFSANRFPGRERSPGEGSLRSGSISATWHW